MGSIIFMTMPPGMSMGMEAGISAARAASAADNAAAKPSTMTLRFMISSLKAYKHAARRAPRQDGGKTLTRKGFIQRT